MKSILERALVHLLNEENQKAEELFHQFVIERARNIHETLREADEDMDEMVEEGDGEEFFTDDDLVSDEEEEFAAEDELGDDLDVDADDLDTDLDASEFDPEVESDEDEDVEDRIDDLEDQLSELIARFEEEMDSLNDDEEEVSDEDVSDMGEEEAEAEAEEEEAEEVSDEEFDDEDFDDITEAVIDDLKSVTVPNTDGRYATGQGVNSPSTKSAHGTKNKAGPAKSKAGGEHKGFDRQTPPSSEPTRGGSTVASKADWNAVNTEKGSSVPNIGEKNIKPPFKKGAKLNNKPAVNNKSVVGKTNNPK